MKEGIALVIGGNRGIGYNLVKALRSGGWTVYASVRPQTRADKSDPSCGELEATGAKILEIDTLVEATILQAKKEFGDGRLDVLVNSAASAPPPDSWLDHTPEILMDKFAINVVGPFMTTKAFLPNLALSPTPKIINFSSDFASIKDNITGCNLAYRLTKTAINQFSKTLAAELPLQDPPSPFYTSLNLSKTDTAKICILSIHPGFIPTKMTGFEGPDDMEECVRGIVERVEQEEDEWEGKEGRSGGYFNWKGEVMDW